MPAPSPVESEAAHQAVGDALWRLTLILGEIAQRVDDRHEQEHAAPTDTDDANSDAA